MLDFSKILSLISFLLMTGVRAEQYALPVPAPRPELSISITVGGARVPVWVRWDGTVVVEQYPDRWIGDLQVLPATTVPEFSHLKIESTCKQVAEKVSLMKNLPAMALERMLKDLRQTAKVPVRMDVFSGWMVSSILNSVEKELLQAGHKVEGPLQLENPLSWEKVSAEIVPDTDSLVASVGAIDGLSKSVEALAGSISLKSGIGLAEISAQDLLCDLWSGRARVFFTTQSIIPSEKSFRSLVPTRVAHLIYKRLEEMRPSWELNLKKKMPHLNYLQLGRILERSLAYHRSTIRESDLLILVSQLVDENSGELREFKSDWIRLFQVPSATERMSGRVSMNFKLPGGSP